MISKTYYDSLVKKYKSVKLKDSRTLFESICNEELDEYDIFISYSSNDRDYALATKHLLESMYINKTRTGYTVYIDSDDVVLNPHAVSEETAIRLNNIIKRSKAILYIHSDNSELSKWCPWELGVGQGLQKEIAIIEITDKTPTKQEYLELYPTVKYNNIKDTPINVFWVYDRKNPKLYVHLAEYVFEKKKPFLH